MELIIRVTTTLSFIVALSLSTACNRGDPSQYVSKALKEANLESVKVDWDGEARVAHLRGTVDRPTDRQRAEDVAAAAVGTTGRVLNELTIKGINESTADDMDRDIRSHLKKMIDSDAELRQRDIDFDVNNGAVTVKGDVASVSEKTRVSELVKAAPGVKDMVNALEIKPKK
jgi:osmotically-inducible protein OsmY